MPGPPPLGPRGASQGLPGGGSRPNVCGPEPGEPPMVFASICMSILMSIFGRLGVDLGPLLGSCWGHFCVFSARVGPGTVFESSYLQNNEFSPDITFPIIFLNVFTPNMAPPNDSRSLQDGSKIVLDPFFCLLLFCFDC